MIRRMKIKRVERSKDIPFPAPTYYLRPPPLSPFIASVDALVLLVRLLFTLVRDWNKIIRKIKIERVLQARAWLTLMLVHCLRPPPLPQFITSANTQPHALISPIIASDPSIISTHCPLAAATANTPSSSSLLPPPPPPPLPHPPPPRPLPSLLSPTPKRPPPPPPRHHCRR